MTVLLSQKVRELLDQNYWIEMSGVAWRYFDIGASVIWAMTGALLAAKRGYDLSGLFTIALVSSTGGGLLRDGFFLQLGPPALVRTPVYIAIAAAAAFVVWAYAHRSHHLARIERVATWADAVGLGGFAVVGMQLASAANASLLGVLLIGIVNAVGGGLLRSLLMREVPDLFRPGHFMALAVLPGCILYEVLTVWAGVGPKVAAIPTVLLVALLRRLSIHFSVRTRPPLGHESAMRRLNPAPGRRESAGSARRVRRSWAAHAAALRHRRSPGTARRHTSSAGNRGPRDRP